MGIFDIYRGQADSSDMFIDQQNSRKYVQNRVHVNVCEGGKQKGAFSQAIRFNAPP